MFGEINGKWISAAHLSWAVGLSSQAVHCSLFSCSTARWPICLTWRSSATHTQCDGFRSTTAVRALKAFFRALSRSSFCVLIIERFSNSFCEAVRVLGRTMEASETLGKATNPGGSFPVEPFSPCFDVFAAIPTPCRSHCCALLSLSVAAPRVLPLLTLSHSSRSLDRSLARCHACVARTRHAMLRAATPPRVVVASRARLSKWILRPRFDACSLRQLHTPTVHAAAPATWALHMQSFGSDFSVMESTHIRVTRAAAHPAESELHVDCTRACRSTAAHTRPIDAESSPRVLGAWRRRTTAHHIQSLPRR